IEANRSSHTRSCSRSVKQRTIELTALTHRAAKQAARMFRWCVDQLRPPVIATARATVGCVASRRRRENIVRTNAPPDASDASGRAYETAGFAACGRI